MTDTKPELVASIPAIPSGLKVSTKRIDLDRLELPERVREQLLQHQKAREQTAAEAHLIRLG